MAGTTGNSHSVGDAENIDPQFQQRGGDDDLTENSLFCLTSQQKNHQTRAMKKKASTPSKRTTDAGFYFQNLPTTPLHDVFKSAQKKHHRTSHIFVNNDNENVNDKKKEVSNSFNHSQGDIENSMDSSTDRAFEELKLALDENSSVTGTTPSSTTEKMPSSSTMVLGGISRHHHNSLGSSSSSSSSSSSTGSGIGDILNRSVLSDTTEMTASNFILVAKSKQCMLESAREEEKKRRKEQKQRLQQQQQQENDQATRRSGQDRDEEKEEISLESTKEELALLVAPKEGNQDPGDGGTDKIQSPETSEVSNLSKKQPLHLGGEGIQDSPKDLSGSPLETTKANLSTMDLEKDVSAKEGENECPKAVLPSNATNHFTAAVNGNATAAPMTSRAIAPPHQQGSGRKYNVTTTRNARNRKSLLTGASPSNLKNRIQVSPKSLRKFTATLQRSRLQGQFERDREIKKQMSMGSAVKPPKNQKLLEPGLPSTIGIHQEGHTINSMLSLGSAFAAVGLNTLGGTTPASSTRKPHTHTHTQEKTQTPGDYFSRLAQSSNNSEQKHSGGKNNLLTAVGSASNSTGSPDDEPGSMHHWELSNQLAQSPFDTEQKREERTEEINGEASPAESVQAATDNNRSTTAAGESQHYYEDTAEINFEYDKWIRRPMVAPVEHDSIPSARDSNSAAILRRLATTEPEDSPASQDEGEESSSTHVVDHGINQEHGQEDNRKEPEDQARMPDSDVTKDSPSSPTTGTHTSDDATNDDASSGVVDSLFAGLNFDDESKHSNNRSRSSNDSEETDNTNSPRQQVQVSSDQTGSPSIGGSPLIRSSPRSPALLVAQAPPNDSASENTSMGGDVLQSLTSPADDHTTASSRRTPNSSSKLTPSGLTKRPRRITNPHSLHSPAHNTRSAKKRRSFFGSGSLQQEEDQNAQFNTSFASSISSGADSRRSSATASMAEIGDIFDFANQSTTRGYGGRRSSIATNRRRETASFSDLGEVLGFLENNDDSEEEEGVDSTSRRGSQNARPTRRRSSLLTSLPESESLADTMDSDADSTEPSRNKKRASSRKSRRRESSMFLPSVPALDQDGSSGDEEMDKIETQSNSPHDKSLEDNRGSSLAAGTSNRSLMSQPNDNDDESSSPNTHSFNEDETITVHDDAYLRNTSAAKEQQQLLDSPARNTRSATKKKLQEPGIYESGDRSDTRDGRSRKEDDHPKNSHNFLTSADTVPSPRRHASLELTTNGNNEEGNEQSQHQQELNVLQRSDALPQGYLTTQNNPSALDQGANIRAVDSPARNTRSACKKREQQTVERPTDPLSFFERLTQSQQTPEQEKSALDNNSLNQRGKMEEDVADEMEGANNSSEPSSNLESREQDNSLRKEDTGENSTTLKKVGSRESAGSSIHSRSSGNDTVTSSEFGALLSLASAGSNNDKEATSAPSSSQSKGEKRPRSTPDQLGATTGLCQTEDDEPREGKRRRPSPISNVGEEGNTETASLGDIEGLLGRFAAQDTSLASASSVSMEGSIEGLSPSNNANEPCNVPCPGVLSSAMKKKSETSTLIKRVGFKSPEAAEYDIGSVAKSLTPMPAGQAKALFPMPSPDERSSARHSERVGDMSLTSRSSSGSGSNLSYSTSSASAQSSRRDGGGDMSFDSHSSGGSKENDVSLTSSSSTLASSNSNDGTSNGQPLAMEDRTVTLELDIDQLMSKIPAGDELPASGANQNRPRQDKSGNDSSMNESQDSQEEEVEDVTVELEGNMQGLLAVTAENQSGEKTSPPGEGVVEDDSLLSESNRPNESDRSLSIEMSVDMADSNCIVSANVAPAEGDRQPITGQRLQFDDSNDSMARLSSPSVANEESQGDDCTLPLEVNMEALLGQVGPGAPEESELERLQLDVSAIPKSSPSLTGSLQLHSQLSEDSNGSTLGFSKFSESSASGSEGATTTTSQENTVQLENNVHELLAATAAAGESTHHKQDHSPSFTTNLEENMAMVLKSNTNTNANAPEYNSQLESGLDLESALSPGGKSRRSSISSHRLSLVPPGRLSISRNGEINGEERSFFVQPSSDNSNDDGHHGSELAQDRTITFDMDGEELLTRAGLQKNEECPLQLKDIIMELTSHLEGPATKSFTSLLLAICEELEQKTEDLSVDMNVAFGELISGKEDLFLNLQNQLRDPNDITTREEVEYLACAINESGHLEWANWLAVVMGSFKDSFAATTDSIKADSKEVAKGLDLIGEAHKEQRRIVNASTRRARRKSMNRRKTTSASLEEDIKDLELEIATLQEEVQSIKSRDSKACEMELALTAKHSKQKEWLVIGSQAALGRARSEHLKGMFRWEPGLLTSSKMAFKLQGMYPESSVSLTFTIEDQIDCHAKVDATAYRKRAGVTQKLSKTSAALLTKTVGELLQSHIKTPIQTRSDIGPFLSLLELRLGRLEQLAIEITNLECIYETNASFVRGNLSFKVEFSKCLASFEVESTYPFAPMSVDLNIFKGGEDINERRLHRHLVKQVKPGHQYLSRLCACLATYLDEGRK